MRILTLDDMEVRQNAFRTWFREHEHHIALDAQTAIDLLDASGRVEPVFDLVMLDHDLAEEHYLIVSEGLSEEPLPGHSIYSPGTGMDVVDHIIAMPPERRPRTAIVHSYNSVRAPLMRSKLAGAGVIAYRIPFGRNPLG